MKEAQREKVIDPVGNSQSHIPGQLSTMPPPLPSVHPQGASILIIHKRGRCAGLLDDLSGLDKGPHLVSNHLLGLLSLCHTLKIMEIEQFIHWSKITLSVYLAFRAVQQHTMSANAAGEGDT